MRQSSRRSKPEYQTRIAKERIEILVDEAVKAAKIRPDLSKRYAQLAKKIGMRYNVRIPKHLKRKFCKYCNAYLSTGWRFKKGRMQIACANCKKIIRYPYKPRK